MEVGQAGFGVELIPGLALRQEKVRVFVLVFFVVVVGHSSWQTLHRLHRNVFVLQAKLATCVRGGT
jgi:hypothetical protein